MPKWESNDTHIIYRRFGPGESLVGDLEAFALSEGITEAAITSCIGSLRQLRLRNLCEHDPEGAPVFERNVLDENLELVSAEGYIQPLPEGGIRVHVHLAAARPFRRDGRRPLRGSHHLHRRVHVYSCTGSRKDSVSAFFDTPLCLAYNRLVCRVRRL